MLLTQLPGQEWRNSSNWVKLEHRKGFPLQVLSIGQSLRQPQKGINKGQSGTVQWTRARPSSPPRVDLMLNNLPCENSCYQTYLKNLHPGRLTWNLKITQLKRKIIFQTCIIMFHFNFQGCNENQILKTSTKSRIQKRHRKSTTEIIFSLYIAFATLVMLNLVTGVFVEGTGGLQNEKHLRIWSLARHLWIAIL